MASNTYLVTVSKGDVVSVTGARFEIDLGAGFLYVLDGGSKQIAVFAPYSWSSIVLSAQLVPDELKTW